MADRFEELILHFCQRSEGDTNFGTTKLNKLLWFTDMTAYLSTGRTVTGQEYKKLPFGPVPVDYEETIDAMCARRAVHRRVEDRYGYPQKRLLALVEPNLSVFSADEIALADDMVNRFRTFNGSEISNLSHEFLGWQLADIGETIPLEVGFVERRQLHPQEMAYATSLTSTPEYVECHAD